MIGNLNEISLFTQAYFTMLTTIHESKNYLMMISVLQLRAVPRLYRLPDPEAEHLQQLRGLRVQHRRQGDGSLPQAVQEDGPRGHLDTLLTQRYFRLHNSM